MKDLKKKLKKEKENAEKAEARAQTVEKKLEGFKAKEAADSKVNNSILIF